MLDIMLECVLPWEREPFWPKFSDSGLLEDGAVAVKAVQSILDFPECGLGDRWTPDKIAEVQKRGYGTCHILGHISLDCWEPNLRSVVRGGVRSMGGGLVPS